MGPEPGSLSLGGRTFAVKAGFMLSHRKSAYRIAPLSRDLAQRINDEMPPGPQVMRNDQPVVSPTALRPENDVEIKHPVAPAQAGAALSEFGFDRLEPVEQCWRRQRRFD